MSVSSYQYAPSEQPVRCVQQTMNLCYQQSNFPFLARSLQPQQSQTSCCFHQVQPRHPSYDSSYGYLNNTTFNSMSHTPCSFANVRMTPAVNVVPTAVTTVSTPPSTSVPVTVHPSTTVVTSWGNSPTFKSTRILEIFQQYYPNLVKLLPMNDDTFIAELYKNHLLPGNLKANMKSLSTSTQKATEFLDNVVKPSVECDDGTSLNALLITMKGCGDITVKRLAEKINNVLNQQSYKASSYVIIFT